MRSVLCPRKSDMCCFSMFDLSPLHRVLNWQVFLHWLLISALPTFWQILTDWSLGGKRGENEANCKRRSFVLDNFEVKTFSMIAVQISIAVVVDCCLVHWRISWDSQILMASHRCHSVFLGLMCLFCLYYVFHINYEPEAEATLETTLEFIQWYGIHL